MKTVPTIRLCPKRYFWEEAGEYKPGEDVTIDGGKIWWFHPYDGGPPFKVSSDQ